MWPYIGEYVKDLLITRVEPSVQQSLPNSLKPFKFEKIDLGDLVSQNVKPITNITHELFNKYRFV